TSMSTMYSSSCWIPSSISVSNSTYPPRPNRITCSAGGGVSVAERKAVNTTEPLLLNAVRGEDVERPPVWLMRQAGRYMKSYQTLCEKHPSFRERSENVDLVVEISLQPWKVFKPDGVILFSDILTPLPGMNIPFDIVKGKGPIIYDPISTADDVAQVKEFTPEEWVPYVGEALTILRKEVNNEAAVLGFVGAPFTLASYVVEGGSSKNFTKIKKLAFSQPESYQTLCEKHPSFRERSENVDLVVEISLQPWKVFKPDGVILFSDILTPLPGMNIPFDIVKGKGPIIYDPISTADDVAQVKEFTPEEWVPYVGEALTILRKELVQDIQLLHLTSK
nr:uroporphyrinogen decarboxylase [Tanacetum cinerariifolium]